MSPTATNQTTQLSQTDESTTGDQDDVIRRLQKPINKNRVSRIYLESQKRLILLFEKNDKQLVKCFMNAPHKQVGLYVEAEEGVY